MAIFNQNLILIFLLVLVSGLYAQNEQDKIHDIRVDVVYLSSDYLNGRETGTDSEKMAADYISKRFEAIGLIPFGEAGGWYRYYDFTFNPNPHATGGGEKRTGRNIVGYIDNGAPTTVVIGAHFDHIGNGGFGSRHTGAPAIHNGADDNASGVSGLLYIADYLKNKSMLKGNNYIIVAFSGEELGLFGSKNFVNDEKLDLTSINYMLNMDMIGRLNDKKSLIINGVGTSPVWKAKLDAIDVGGIHITTTESGVGPSDHTSFYLKDLPVLHFFTGIHQQYHKPEDDAHLINYSGILDVSSFIIALIESLDKAGKIEFTKTKDDAPDRKAADFKVTLGVMPDYSFEGEGMRIEGVLSDRPAEKAALKGGDVLIQIGEIQIKNIYDYMEGLSKFKAGDQTVIKIKRGEEILEKTVSF